jgi:hypothetical protein
MRGRSRGKGAARIKAIAFGIFIAGSVGMLAGRLLQAAVSRRREHLADASAVQFTRNPQALQGAFVVMAASPQGTRLLHEGSADVAHMMFAGSEPAWAAKVGGSWFATHPPLEERVRAIDARMTSSRFKLLVSEERRKMNARAKQAAAEGGDATAREGQPAAGEAQSASLEFSAAGAMAAVASALPLSPGVAKQNVKSAAPAAGELSLATTQSTPVLAETLPSGVRLVSGRALPPDVLRNRLSQEQQSLIQKHLAGVEDNAIAVQATYIAALLASEPAKWRTQLTRLAPVLGIELFKETQVQSPRLAALAPAARLPLLCDLLTLLDGLDPAHRKRLRGVARAFAPTVSQGDMLRYVVTRVLERRLAKASDAPPPVPLPERATQVCELFASLAHCRFGAGKQGLNSYRAGLMGLMPPQKWLPFPETPLAPAALDAALAGVTQIHPTGKRSFSEGMGRVIAVGGRLTVPQVDLLRGICQLVDCPVPLLPVDVVFEDADLAPPRHQASAR